MTVNFYIFSDLQLIEMEKERETSEAPTCASPDQVTHCSRQLHSTAILVSSVFVSSELHCIDEGMRNVTLNR